MLDFCKKNTVLLKNKRQGIMPTTMLKYLVIHNSFVSEVYIEYKADMICHHHHLYYEQYFIQQNIIKLMTLNVIITVSLLFVHIYSLGQKTYPTFNVS